MVQQQPRPQGFLCFQDGGRVPSWNQTKLWRLNFLKSSVFKRTDKTATPKESFVRRICTENLIIASHLVYQVVIWFTTALFYNAFLQRSSTFATNSCKLPGTENWECRWHFLRIPSHSFRKVGIFHCLRTKCDHMDVINKRSFSSGRQWLEDMN